MRIDPRGSTRLDFSPVGRTSRRRTPAPSGRSLERLGLRIRTIREAAGLTQAELGHPYVTRSAVARIEAGLSSPKYATLLHLARKLRVSIHELIPEP